jgi:hypothetical protein
MTELLLAHDLWGDRGFRRAWHRQARTVAVVKANKEEPAIICVSEDFELVERAPVIDLRIDQVGPI